MMTVYTAINVPYGSMLGVMTDDSREKTVFSSYRMFFAYVGSFIVLGAWEPAIKYFNILLGVADYPGSPRAWQYTMVGVAIVCLLLFLLTFLLTKERVRTTPKASLLSDLGTLLRNGPWWILLGAVLFFNLISNTNQHQPLAS